MNEDIFNYSEINVSDVHFDMPQKKKNFYYSLVNYNKKNNLLCHVANVQFIEYKEESIPTIKVIIDNKFKKFLELLDKQCEEIINDNKQKWFNKDIPKEIITKMYNRIIKEPDENSIEIRVAKLNDKIICKIFDMEKIRINMSDINMNDKFACIINLKGIIINKKSLKYDLCINQIKLNRESIPKPISSDKCIINDDEEEKYSDEYIDNIDIEESYIKDKIKLLYSQKMEDIEMINQLNTRIKNIEEEIKLLKYKININ